MGWKDWVYGDLVSAAEFQSLVQDQTVQRYASSSARSAALGSAVAEGMVSYLDDTNAVEVYNGSSWTSVAPATGFGNAIINGAFDFWQRGTSFTYTGGYPYTADRWRFSSDGSGATKTITQQTFTPGAAPVAGYESAYFLRFNQSVAGSGGTYSVIEQLVEDVRTFAGQTVTMSFWAKADAARTIKAGLSYQIFGSGGSSNVSQALTNVTLTTSWARYSVTVSVPSISGKTIGTGSFTIWGFELPLNTTQTIDIWGVQLEAGSSATAFKRNAPSIQGELAACQRYYQRVTATGMNYLSPAGFAASSTGTRIAFPLRTTLRAPATSIEYSSLRVSDGSNFYSVTSLTIDGAEVDSVMLNATVSSGLTQFRPYGIYANTLPSYFGISAEL